MVVAVLLEMNEGGSTCHGDSHPKQPGVKGWPDRCCGLPDIAMTCQRGVAGFSCRCIGIAVVKKESRRARWRARQVDIGWQRNRNRHVQRARHQSRQWERAVGSFSSRGDCGEISFLRKVVYLEETAAGRGRDPRSLDQTASLHYAGALSIGTTRK